MKGFSKGLLASSALTLLALISCAPQPAGGTPSNGSIPLTGATSAPGEVQHQLIPDQLPEQRSSHAGDQDSSATAKQKRANGGDRFTLGQFERPFNGDTMDVYFPYLDIQEAFLYQDDTWVYAAIRVADRDAQGALPGKYAVELDLDLDGRGDFLIVVTNPASTDWSTNGVQAWTDGNDDVGGSTVVKADKAPSTGDGYDTLVFGQGQGQDPDAAWARISPDDPKTIQLAGKRSLLGGDSAYLAGVWTGNADLEPALFDLNDRITHDQAGEAMVELEYYYPIKQLSEVDNTCRMAVGFEPSGNEPGVCTSSIPGVCKPAPGSCNTFNGYHWNSELCCCAYETYGCDYSP